MSRCNQKTFNNTSSSQIIGVYLLALFIRYLNAKSYPCCISLIYAHQGSRASISVTSRIQIGQTLAKTALHDRKGNRACSVLLTAVEFVLSL